MMKASKPCQTASCCQGSLRKLDEAACTANRDLRLPLTNRLVVVLGFVLNGQQAGKQDAHLSIDGTQQSNSLAMVRAGRSLTQSVAAHGI